MHLSVENKKETKLIQQLSKELTLLSLLFCFVFLFFFFFFYTELLVAVKDGLKVELVSFPYDMNTKGGKNVSNI